MPHIVKCRGCGKTFDRDILQEGIDWVLPTTNRYYHKLCFEQWAKKQGQIDSTLSEEEWFEALLYYLNHVIKAPIDYKKLTSQWKNLLKQQKTAKGIYFTIRYFYDTLHGDKEKSQGGIGIVSLIYQDSCAYWGERFKRDNMILKKIEEQVREQLLQKVVQKPQSKKETIRNKIISLDDIE